MITHGSVTSVLRAWSTSLLRYVDLTVNASGELVTTTAAGGGGGGGPVTVADGADVAQGATTDASSASTVIGLLKNLKAALAGTLGISGTVTANAGTNLNTSALALDATLTGGTQKTKLIDSGGANVASVSATGAVKVDGSGVTQPVSGTFWQATQPVSGPLTDTQLRASAVPVSGPTLTKGTQGSTGFSVQDLKDAGRTQVSYWATGVTAGTSGTEALITLTKGLMTGAATSSGTSFVITSGKRFRITSIVVAVRNMAATTAVGIFTLRINSAGAITTTSNAGTQVRAAVSATINSWDRAYLDLLEGVEILGDGTLQFGMTVNPTWTTTAMQYDVVITGYEY